MRATCYIIIFSLIFVNHVLGTETVTEENTIEGSQQSRGVTKNIATAEICDDTEVNLTKLKLLYVESPSYGIGGENYPTGQECTLFVKGNSACQVAAICKDSDLRPALCNEEYLEIANGREDGRPTTKLCGDSASSDYFKADMDAPAGKQNTLRFELRTAQNSEFDRVYKGFRCLVKCMEPEGGTGEEGPGPSTCPPCECVSNTTIECPMTTCPNIITACPEVTCTTPAPIDCPTTTCAPCNPCELTTTVCPNITCTSAPSTTTCPQIDCPSIEPETCPATTCPPCECPTTAAPTQCPVINCPPPSSTTACPIIECPTTIQTICPPPTEPTPCPEKVCPACPEPECPPPKCPEAPPPPRFCDTFYTIVNTIDNNKLDSRFSRDRGVGSKWFDIFGFSLDRWWITEQDVGVRITSTSKPTFAKQFYALRMHNQTFKLGLEVAANANRLEFKWKMHPRIYGKQDEYVAIENQYNNYSIQYDGYGKAVIMAPTDFGEIKQWWKLIPEGDFIGCTKYCKIMSKHDYRLLSLNTTEKRVITLPYNGGNQVAWNIIHEVYGYRITATDMDGNWSLSDPPDQLKEFTSDNQDWHFLPASGPGGWYFIKNVHTSGYLKNMLGNPVRTVPESDVEAGQSGDKRFLCIWCWTKMSDTMLPKK